jgi:hypothetical protein
MSTEGCTQGAGEFHCLENVFLDERTDDFG